MLERFLNMFGVYVKFTDDDDFYRNLDMKDYGLDKIEGLEKDLSNLPVYESEIPFETYSKFIMKLSWTRVMKTNESYLVSIIFSLIIAVFAMITMSIIGISFFVVSALITIFFRRRLKRFVRDFKCLEVLRGMVK